MTFFLHILPILALAGLLALPSPPSLRLHSFPPLFPTLKTYFAKTIHPIRKTILRL
jgi:hypothetical protein